MKPLGVGILYNPSLPEFLSRHIDIVDYIGVIPETFWTDRGMGHRARYAEIPVASTFLERIAASKPLVAHGLGLSIGSAGVFDVDHLEQVERWRTRFDFAWYSEHLSFARLPGQTTDYNAGMALPIPYDEEVFDLIAERVRIVMAKVTAEFLLENNVYYSEIPEQDMSETQFLNRLTQATDCGLLLDLHNLFTNCVNHKLDPLAYLASLDMKRVVEIHVAGGNKIGRLHTDAHSGPCPPQVWELLDTAMAAASAVRGVTFEFHESYYPTLGEAGIQHEIGMARSIWNKYH